jgi:ceramide glucosyltransferase
LIEAYPHADIALVIDDRVSGSNLKISNLINMERLVKYDTLVVADSDVSVTPDYLTRLMAALAQPNVGYATCVYFGVPTGNLWSRISAMSINYHLLPSVALGVRLKMAEPCFGPTMAFRRDVFERAGGFRAFADRLADDFEIGHAIRKLGYTFAISPIAIGHACPETTGRAVVSHELRWARTIRLIDPTGYAGTVVCHPVFFALAATPFLHGSMISLGGVALALAARTFLALQVDRLSPLKLGAWGLGPLRDLMSTGVFFASFMGRNVMWRGRRLRIAADGDLQVRRRTIRWRAGPWLTGRRANQSTATPQRILP